jgi:hypothetical protein
MMSGYRKNAQGGSRRSESGKAIVVASRSGRVRVRKSSSRKLRDLPELDLRTPSGRLLPF